MLCHVRTMFDSSLQISLTVSSAASKVTTASMFMSLSPSPLSSVSTYEQNRQTDRVREIERERESMRERERERERERLTYFWILLIFTPTCKGKQLSYSPMLW